MKVSLLTDAPKHNLALMKLAAWHKSQGDTVSLNMPLFPADYTYASVLFERNKNRFIADEYGGPAYEGTKLPEHIEKLAPGYFLYERLRRGDVGYSLGYTFRPCYRGCSFCKVPGFDHPDTEHHSIWEFHNPEFDRICLLNNNTFMDPRWRETFEEIWDADLTVIDENGYDLRLIDDEKAAALKKTRFKGDSIGLAWDQMSDEVGIRRGLDIAKKHHLTGHNTNIFILCGYDTTEEQDLYRLQIIGKEYDCRPYIMPFTEEVRRFKRFVDTFMWRKYDRVEDAWKDYKR